MTSTTDTLLGASTIERPLENYVVETYRKSRRALLMDGDSVYYEHEYPLHYSDESIARFFPVHLARFRLEKMKTGELDISYAEILLHCLRRYEAHGLLYIVSAAADTDLRLFLSSREIQRDDFGGIISSADGSRVVSFSDRLSITFTGNYRDRSHKVGRRIGSGWRISEGIYPSSGKMIEFVNSRAPSWAISAKDWEEGDIVYLNLEDMRMETLIEIPKFDYKPYALKFGIEIK